MKNKIVSIVVLLCLSILLNKLYAQDDLLSLLDSVKTGEPKKSEKVFATFKTTKVISAQSIETVKAKTMDFRITHRFGNIGANSNGGIHTLYGWDAIEDVRFSFDFGITDQLMIGIARSKVNEMLDGLVKYRFLEQTRDNKIPLTIAAYADMSFTPQRSSSFYNGTVNVKENAMHRLSYFSQVIFARKFGERFSLEVIPSYLHRNFVKAYVNADNGKMDENDLFAVAVAGRFKITKRFGILADYFYTFSEFRKNNPATKYYNPLALGVEIETGGHVFHINFTNASGIIENSFLPNTTDSWLKGGYKFGFNISRVFNI